MRASMHTIHCDADDGECGTWDTDYYESCADTVNGIKITREHPAPGWTVKNDHDYCPDHTNGDTK